MPQARSSVRIIAGKWRSRRVPFLTDAFVRPTPDRVRETVFNWLMPVLHGARCADLCAGSGIMGFEALSRGVDSVEFVERDPDVVAMLQETQTELAADSAEITCASLQTWLARAHQPFDIIFLDPPYSEQALLMDSLSVIEKRQLLSPKGYLYMESDTSQSEGLPEAYKIYREKRMGGVHFYLVQLT